MVSCLNVLIFIRIQKKFSLRHPFVGSLLNRTARTPSGLPNLNWINGDECVCAAVWQILGGRITETTAGCQPIIVSCVGRDCPQIHTKYNITARVQHFTIYWNKLIERLTAPSDSIRATINGWFFPGRLKKKRSQLVCVRFGSIMKLNSIYYSIRPIWNGSMNPFFECTFLYSTVFLWFLFVFLVLLMVMGLLFSLTVLVKHFSMLLDILFDTVISSSSPLHHFGFNRIDSNSISDIGFIFHFENERYPLLSI